MIDSQTLENLEVTMFEALVSAVSLLTHWVNVILISDCIQMIKHGIIILNESLFHSAVFCIRSGRRELPLK